jgi:hypothetical protein
LYVLVANQSLNKADLSKHIDRIHLEGGLLG